MTHLVLKRWLCYDAVMEKKDILHLASLSRIKITDVEAESLKGEIESVLAYVSMVNDIAADVSLTKKVGPVHNVFREDIVTHGADMYTEVLLREVPKKSGRYVQVKKIIQQD
jgi:aspartyl-tRNA(Asn)/glutamyl-tRNA(Gln) amidotransferase subunit C